MAPVPFDTSSKSRASMIGVIANRSDPELVTEFFELFKTPWEFYCPERLYDVVIVCGDESFPAEPVKFLIHYSSSHGVIGGEGKEAPNSLSYKGERIPIYRNSATFDNANTPFLREEG